MLATPLRVLEGNARVYRRQWKGSVVTAFLNPVLFLLAMGLGLGTLVDRAGEGGLGGLPYIAFLAPGLLAATAMQTGAAEGSFPVMAGIKWVKNFHAALVTPVRVADLVSGNLMWIAVRILMACAAFVIVTVLFGGMPMVDGIVGLAPALLTGMAFAAPLTAYTAVAKNETRLSTTFRFAIVPMFLFSGTFFPIEQLPELLQPVARVTPLWHGVELSRHVVLGFPTDLPIAIHVGYLALWTLAGWLLALVSFRRKLLP